MTMLRVSKSQRQVLLDNASLTVKNFTGGANHIINDDLEETST